MPIKLKNNCLILNVEILTLCYLLLFRSINLFNIASTNIAVKNRLNEGIKSGYHSFWNKLYK